MLIQKKNKCIFLKISALRAPLPKRQLKGKRVKKGLKAYLVPGKAETKSVATIG